MSNLPNPITPGIYRMRCGRFQIVEEISIQEKDWKPDGRYLFSGLNDDWDLIERISDLPGTAPAVDPRREDRMRLLVAAFGGPVAGYFADHAADVHDASALIVTMVDAALEAMESKS